MKQYLDLLSTVKLDGTQKGDRTGTGTTSIFGHQMKFDLRKGFPMVTTKKLHFKSIAVELLWLLSGNTNIKAMQGQGVKIWDNWADENGDLGNVYGKAWRDWVGDDGVSIDQITQVIQRIKDNPDCRRQIVSAWNPTWIPESGDTFSESVQKGKGALPPCHAFFQYYTVEMHPNDRVDQFQKAYVDKIEEWDLRTSEYEAKMDELDFPTRWIDCQLYQRSADSFLGVPYNIASYALLQTMVGREVNMIPRNFIHTFGDAHIYNNHIEQIDLQLTREPKTLPTIVLNPDIKKVLDFQWKDITLINYDAHPHIAGKVSV